MRKIFTILLCLTLLSACKVQTAELTTTAESTTAATTATIKTTTVTETTPVTTKNTRPDMDEYWINEYERRLKNQGKEREYAELSAETKFYECEYTQDIVLSGESCPNTEKSAGAEKFFLGTQAYLDIYAEALEYYKELGGADIDGFTVGAKLVQSVTFDFNNDGREESAFLFSLSPADSMQTADEAAFMAICCAIDYNAPRYLVLMDADGDFTLSDMNYAGNAELYRLRYSSFSHLVISGGLSNNSSCADFFSVNEQGYEHELREFQAYGILDGVFLCQTMVQVSDNWLIFWNEENQCYVTPEAVYLSPEESLEISADFPERLSRPVTVIGGIYSEYGGRAYRLIDGKFQPFDGVQTGLQKAWYESYGERKNPISREFHIPYVKNFDYQTALMNVVPLDYRE
ncbi:MAG: hypothetical protein IJ416_10065 [Ruminiclostridium sp.]|nr:hypothetical protein [Ruminiclostridium sp.]